MNVHSIGVKAQGDGAGCIINMDMMPLKLEICHLNVMDVNTWMEMDTGDINLFTIFLKLFSSVMCNPLYSSYAR